MCLPEIFIQQFNFGIRKISPQKIARHKTTPLSPPPENLPLQNCTPLKIPPYEYSPLWKLPPVKITTHNISPEKIAPWENSPPPGKITPNEISSPLINHTNERKNKITHFFFEENPYQNNQGPLWCTDDFTENIGLRYFLYRVKKNAKIERKQKIAKWHLLDSCTRQGKLKLGSQIIKFG